ncbi:unnamed protein product [Rotaria socialis]|nr:unnamed protein product [Rotaria socialis]
MCNEILNCANGADEVFCRITDPPWNDAYHDRFLLDIDIDPPTTVTAPLLIKNIEYIESLQYERQWYKGLTLDVNARAALNQFDCAYPVGFTGLKCEKETAHLNIHLESKLIAKTSYIYIYIYQYIQSDDSYRHLLKNVQLEKPLPIFHRNQKLHKFDFAFIPLAIERNRCPYIDPSFNEKILNFVSLQRAKFDQEPYHNYSTLFCFHNDIFMCICERFRLTQWFFGNLCRFTTSQYSISFDAPSGPILAIEKGLSQ